jgi:hypothetical protein
LQPLSLVPQPPLPLQSFLPLQDAFSLESCFESDFPAASAAKELEASEPAYSPVMAAAVMMRRVDLFMRRDRSFGVSTCEPGATCSRQRG